jgi:hypothetical protein
MMIDRPYTEEDHTHYDVDADVFPADLNDLLKRALQCVEPGGRVGVLDYLWPSPPTKLGKEVAVIAVGTGRNNRARWFTVFERLVEKAEQETPEDDGTEAASAHNPPTTSEEPTPPTPPAASPSKRRRRRKVEEEPVASAPVAAEGTVGPAIAPVGEPPKTECVACGGKGLNSKGNPCVCVNKMTAADKAAFLAAVKANVCHGCKEGLLLDGPGMEVIEPLVDKPNKWHQACWVQKRRWDAEAAMKGQQQRVLREAQEKGWPICGGCAKPIQPSQKNNDGRHAACGRPRRRRRSTTTQGSIDKGF